MIDPGGSPAIRPHVKGAEPGEALIVTHRVVLDALNNGRVSPRQAEEPGLFRLYGGDGALFRLRAPLEIAATSGAAGLIVQ